MSSTISLLGWLNREYTRPAPIPSGGSRRPETKSKKSCPSSAVLKTKVEVRKTGGLTAPSDSCGAVVQHQRFGMQHVVADVGLRRKRFHHGLSRCLDLEPSPCVGGLGSNE